MNEQVATNQLFTAIAIEKSGNCVAACPIKGLRSPFDDLVGAVSFVWEVNAAAKLELAG